MTDDLTGRDQLIEAFAWWKLKLPGGQVLLADAATNALVAGLDGIALAELAGIPKAENPFEVDNLIDRVTNELDLDPRILAKPESLAIRRMCREVLAGRLSERALSGWVHTRFHHESDFEPLNQLAILDDDFDDLEYAGRDTSPVRIQIREIAAAIVQ